MVVFAVDWSQYSTQPSRSMDLITVLKFSLPSPSPVVEHMSLAILMATLGVSFGYSMWNTGLPAWTIGANVAHSLYWTHCSLTEKCTTEVRFVRTSPAFFRPMERFRATASDDRNCTKDIVSDCVKPSPFLLFCSNVISIQRLHRGELVIHRHQHCPGQLHHSLSLRRVRCGWP
jgi:hypothetical protein